MNFGFEVAALRWMRTGWAIRLLLVVGLLFLSAGAGAVPSQAKSTKPMKFQSGDIFFTDANGVQEYSPTGELQQTIPGTTGAGALCFTPSGNRLVLPGIGVLNKAGQLLPSSWAAAPDGRCAIDAAGNVYVRSGLYQITRYNLKGRHPQTVQLPQGLSYQGTAPYYLALAPDQCTIYYGAFTSDTGRLNVCTNTQGSPLFLDTGMIDDLQFRPNGEMVATGDPAAYLYDSTGSPLQFYTIGRAAGDDFRSVSLDPDGTSFWDCCDSSTGEGGQLEIFRFDIASGQTLTAWPSPTPQPGGMAVYNPQPSG